MDGSELQIILFFLCIFLSGFFSSSETALTSLSEAKTRQLIDEKKAGYKFLHFWLTSPNKILITILIGNNIVNTLSAALATVIAQRAFGNLAIGIATGVVTLLLLIFGEITPKTFAKNNSEKVAPILITFLMPFYWCVTPVVSILTWISDFIIRMFGGKAIKTTPIATEKDIAFMIRLGKEEGVLKKDESKMLENVMEFTDTVVKEIMIPRTDIHAFNKNASWDVVLKKIRELGHSRWPVFDGSIDNIIGLFNVKDLFEVVGEEQIQEKKLKSFKLSNLIRPAIFVPDVMKVPSLLKEFQQRKAHLAIVVDEYGGTSGVVSLEDVIEELVGEIHDEYDDEEKEKFFKKVGNSQYIASGKANIHQIGEVLGIKFSSEESYDSLGGFLISTLGKVPAIGEEITHYGWKFLVKEADEKHIISLGIAKDHLPSMDG